MRLSSLELFGFKSFYNRTVFTFSDGVTALVGPNGCGKSNIVDAIVWVLGERGTKSLRVKEMGDVIFHGSNGKKPVNLAEVTLNLSDGTDGNVSIKRRIYRDGATEYYINGEIVRLKDIQELTLGTGIGVNSYAIIEQGNIEYLAQLKPLERRTIIEETSGITRFQEKKREAFTRMEEVRSNLDRVEDIRQEVGRNLDKALKERDVLFAYEGMRKRLREIDIALLSEAWSRMSRRLERLSEKHEELEKELQARTLEMSTLGEQRAAKAAEMAFTDRMCRELEDRIRGHEKIMETSALELTFTREAISRLEKAGRDLRVRLADAGVREELLRKEIDRIRIKVTAERELETRLAAGREGLTAQREATREGIKGLENRMEEKREALFAAASSLTDVRNRLMDLDRAEKEQKEREVRRIAEAHRLMERLSALRDRERLSAERFHKAQVLAAEIDEEVADIAGRKGRALEETAGLRVHVERLRAEKRGKEDAVRALRGKAAKKGSPLPFRQLIDIIQVPKEAEAAIERLFSREMEYHVFEEHDRRRLSEIAREKKSNFIFFPTNGIFSYQGDSAALAVTCVEGVDEIFLRIDRGEQGIFVADGICVDSRGFILTRSEGEKAGIREAQQKARLDKEIGALEKELSVRTGALVRQEGILRQIEGEEKAARERRQGNQKALAEAEREAAVVRTEITSGEERLDQLQMERDFAEPVPEVLREGLEKSRAGYEGAKEEIEEGMRLIKAEQETLKEAYERFIAAEREQALLIERTRNLAASLERDAAGKAEEIERLNSERQSLADKAAETDGNVAASSARMEALKISHDDARTARDGLNARLDEARTRLGELHAELSRCEEIRAGLAEDQKKLEAKREGVEREYAVLEERRQAARGRLSAEFGIDEVKITVPVDERRLEAERQKIAAALPGLGDVNFRSEKEYEELKERSEFLENQKADLEEAIDSLKKTIAKIDSFSKELFLETFGRVNAAFQRFAPMLFKGGKGMLALDPDNQGVELFIHPPGKKVVRMELLSGGEKALISLSFLLSLMETKPSPFTLMDEIDAPLDDANLVSLLEIMRDISRKTQIVIITHNRITMESSGTIYGITMEEDGISKTVAIKLA